MDYDKLWDERVVESIVDTLDEKIESLKQQLAEKDKEIEKLKIKFAEKSTGLPREGIIQVDICYGNGCIQSELSQYKLYHKDKLSGITIKIDNNNIRHQLCEEIREKVNTSDFQVFGTNALKVNKYIQHILDQIEQGESK